MTYLAHGRITVYNGVRMRSRLEASFAAHLDELGMEWRYEPRCYASIDGQYLPDFLVKKDGLSLFYEVKPPTAETGKALSKMHIIRASDPAANLFVVVPARQRWVTAARCLELARCAPCLGQPFHDSRTIGGADRGLGAA